MTELLDIVDARGKVVGLAPRSECHGNPLLVHRAVHVLVFDQDGGLYLQKRSASKLIQPGKWDTSVGGHLEPGESYEAAANRETLEELGFTPDHLVHLFSYEIRNNIESENIESYRTVYAGRITLLPEEIDDGKFWPNHEIEAALGKGVFTPSFETEYKILARSEDPVVKTHFSCSTR